MSKRKKPETITAVRDDLLPGRADEEGEGATVRRQMTPEEMQAAMRGTPHAAPEAAAGPHESESTVIAVAHMDPEMTVNLSGDDLPLPGRDDLDDPTVNVPAEVLQEVDHLVVQRKHLRGLLEALVFASDSPIKPHELSKLASAPVKLVKELLTELRQDYVSRGFQLEEVAGGYVFRTSAQYAPFIRDLTKQKPVRLTRAQVETLAIIAYRQPITRPEVDDVRGVDSGPVLKLLLERDLVRILGKRDEPGRPLIYGTTTNFLEFFGLKSLKDLPTLREFTELTDESRQTYEAEIGDTAPGEGAAAPDNTIPPAPPEIPENGEQEVADIGADDLEPVASADEAADSHEADQDGPTITTGTPAAAREHRVDELLREDDSSSD